MYLFCNKKTKKNCERLESSYSKTLFSVTQQTATDAKLGAALTKQTSKAN